MYTKTNVPIKFGSFLMACLEISSRKDIQFPTLLTCMEFRCKHMLPHVNAICTVNSWRKSADQFNVYTITEWLYYEKDDSDQVSEMLGVTVHCITSTLCAHAMSNRLHVQKVLVAMTYPLARQKLDQHQSGELADLRHSSHLKAVREFLIKILILLIQ